MVFNEDCKVCDCNDICTDIERSNKRTYTWKEFKDEVWKMIYRPGRPLKDKEWAFRGLSKSHCLQTTLERFRKYSNIPWESLPRVESQLVREIERKSFGFGIPLPTVTDKIWWVSLMQHYGAPTRLLDWTYSPYVAAYFAFEKMLENSKRKSSDHVVIWAIQYAWTREPRKRFRLPRKHSWGKIENSEPHAQDFLFDPTLKKQPFVMQVNTHYLHDRLTIQQGVFLCPTDVSKTFMHNFREMGNWTNKGMVRKLKIRTSDMEEAMAELQKMNITRHSLFPGFAGFAESLKIRGSYFYDLTKERLG
jgi:hypothetical protein